MQPIVTSTGAHVVFYNPALLLNVLQSLSARNNAASQTMIQSLPRSICSPHNPASHLRCATLVQLQCTSSTWMAVAGPVPLLALLDFSVPHAHATSWLHFYSSNVHALFGRCADMQRVVELVLCPRCCQGCHQAHLH